MEDQQVQEEVQVQDKRRLDSEGVRGYVQHTIRPRNQWVLIKKIEREEMQTGDGIILPGGGRSQRGRIVAVAKMPWWKRSLDLNVGDIVVYTNFPIELEDLEELTGEKNLHLVREEEIYAVAMPCSSTS